MPKGVYPRRKQIEPEVLFVKHLTSLITNVLINNKNYVNQYYRREGVSALIADNKRFGEYLLEEIEGTKHLIGLE